MDTQTAIVALIVTGAAVHIGRHLWRMIAGLVKSKSDANAACANCSFAAKEPAAPKSFVSLGEIRIER
jgi:hypothetical protein